MACSLLRFTLVRWTLEGEKVPDILLSGHEKMINEWEFNESLQKTKLKRPNLYRLWLSKK